MGDAFSRYHPLVNFLFFALVLAYSMVLMHPVCLAVSLTGALVYAGELGGRRALAGHLKFALPVLLLAAIVNPAFNHAGITILTYLPSGNPLTWRASSTAWRRGPCCAPWCCGSCASTP
ncbi:MAG: hypothetical protein V8S97_02530 [Oscillospiraceae bacterium]